MAPIHEDIMLPCSTCPWRTNQDASVIPRYNHGLACRMLNSVGEDDAFRPIMACHNSSDKYPSVCLGYLAREGWRNLNVRVLLARGEIANPTAVALACAERGIELEPDYPTVLAKLAASLPE